MRLHNFIIELDLKTKKRKKLNLDFDNDVLAYMQANPGEIVGLFGDNHHPASVRT